MYYTQVIGVEESAPGDFYAEDTNVPEGEVLSDDSEYADSQRSPPGFVSSDGEDGEYTDGAASSEGCARVCVCVCAMDGAASSEGCVYERELVVLCAYF